MSHKQCLGSNSLEQSDDFIAEAPIGLVSSRLFFPLALSMMASASIGIVDMYIAGFLSSDAQAAVGLGDQFLFLLIVVGSGLSTACSSFVSRKKGSREIQECLKFARSSLIIALLFGLLASFIGVFCSKPLLVLLGCSADLQVLAVPYVAFNALANAPFVILLCLSGIFRALGRPLLSVYLWFFTAFVSNALSLAVFFCALPGAKSLNSLAIGWDIGCILGCVLGLYLINHLFRSLSKGEISCQLDSFPEPVFKIFQMPQNIDELSEFLTCSRKLILVATPAILAELSLVLSHLFMYRLLACSESSSSLQAAWTIKLKIEEMLAMIPLMALGMSTGVIVGQNLGAKKNARALNATWKIATFAAFSMLLLGAMISMASPAMAALFSSELATQQSIISFLAPSVVLFPLCALSSILCAAMEGAGQTFYPMLLSLCFQVAARVSFVYLFGIRESVNTAGIGLGLCLAQVLMAFGTLSYFHFCFASKFNLRDTPQNRVIGLFRHSSLKMQEKKDWVYSLNVGSGSKN